MAPRGGALRVLAVVAHPDDEAWALGGALALYASRGADVRVLCATRGEAGVDHEGGRSGAALGAWRIEELRRSCAALGVGEPVVLDLPDGGLSGCDEGRERVRAAMAELAPDVVLTLGPDGGYGHHDHQTVTRWVGVGGGGPGTGDLRASQGGPLVSPGGPLGSPGGPLGSRGGPLVSPGGPLVLHRVFARGQLFPVWQRLRRAGFAGVDAGRQPQHFGDRERDAVHGDRPGRRGGGGSFAAGGEHRPELRLDVSSVLDRRRAAVGAHRSQRRAEDPDSFLLPGLLTALGPVERYVVVGGGLRAEVRGLFDAVTGGGTRGTPHVASAP